jgi:hypothetical protein
MNLGLRAAARRKICSPRRQPWVSEGQFTEPRSGETSTENEFGIIVNTLLGQ